MGRASFEYDEVGNTFYYVLVSFYAIILLPATYFCLRKGATVEKCDAVNENVCQCDGCVQKRKRKAKKTPWSKTKESIKFLGLIIAWAIFALIVKKTMEIEPTHKDYDPYQILGLDQGAESSAVKKAYRDLSKVHHPDRGGDPIFFDKIAKAYQALTDKEARENWEKYGNPDGPQATTFGIALPKWLVSKEYGLWVLAFYALIFMVLMPVIVGIWWYNSIKYSVDKVLLDTTRLYYYFVHKTPRMEIGRMIAVLSGSFEFSKQYNKEIKERESDDIELPRLMKSLPGVNDKGREQPLSMPYALKTRILMHAYLNRLPLESEANQLDEDQRYIVSRTLRLIEELIQCSHNLLGYSHAKIPVETFENFMKLQAMFVQGLCQKNSPLMQLPHITDYNLQHLRKQKINSCHDLAKMDHEKRRSVLRSLSDFEYRNVMIVLSMMPRLQIETKTVVEGEDDQHELTAGCVVTLKITLKRSRLIDPQLDELDQHTAYVANDSEEGDEENEAKENEEKEIKKANKPWMKNKQKMKKGGGKKKTKKPIVKKSPAAPEVAPSTPSTEAKVDEKKNGADDDESASEETSDAESQSDSEKEKNNDSDSDWEADVPVKKNLFETKSVETHEVHAPYYPDDKYEWWWLVLTHYDRREKQRQMVTWAQLVKTLVDEQTIDIRFPAPKEKGIYTYNLSVRSDSYIDAEYSVDVKLDIKESKIVEVKYDQFDDEDEEEAVASSEDEYTEDSDSDNE
ncbi:unnamed protein product [Caenorhabditis bovis]|uniref:J domain-containing protein n=1 Tax=Caenorhabditis bovis TaxID=2654633 RepID=A0A8S1F0J1_9PELO|nr:unnamed protein product [Caenorhabditis bovis]